MTPEPTPSPPAEAIDRTDAVGPLSDVDRHAVELAIDEIVFASLRPVSLGLSLLFLLLIGGHATGLEGVARDVMMPLAGAVAVGLFAMWYLFRSDRIAPRQAHTAAGMIGFLVLVHSVAQIVVQPEPEQASFLFLTVLGAGILFLDARWFAAIAAGAFAGLYVVFQRVPEGQDPQVWINMGIGLFGVSVLAGVVLFLRRRTFERVEALHLQDQQRQVELEEALARTEVARQGEAEARRELEGAFQSIRESEERFRRLADATFEGVLIQRDGKIQDANGRASQMLGAASEDLVGRHLAELIEEGQRAETLHVLQHRMDTGMSDMPVEATGVRADGSTYPLEIRVAPALFDGQPVAVTVLRDATRQKRAEAVLREAAEAAEESNRAKSAFLANMSHELRTPLNAVIGFSNILRKNKNGSFADRDLEYLDRIVSNGKHLLALINDVLDLSKIEAGRMELVIETVEVGELAEDLFRSFELQARRKGVELELDIPEGVGTIEGDGHRLKQILFNLVGNAMKFTDDGSVILHVETESDGVTPRRLDVIDSGIGIPDSRIREIFDPFQQVDASTTRKYGGTGLGLAISRHLCEMMGFTLGATSVEGEGSTFSIDLSPEIAPTPVPLPGGAGEPEGQ